MNQQALTPAFPTFPVQNQFGQPIMFTGLVKIEIIALQMLPYVIREFTHPADAYKEAITMAEDFLKAIDKYIEEQTDEEAKILPI